MSCVRVLIAEDNEDHRFLTVRALRDVEDVDLQIETVADGEEALDYVHRRNEFRDKPRPDLVLLDIRMPKVDGVEVLRQVKADPGLRRIPVIMLTTTDDPREVERCHDIGCSSYIVKPVDYDKFAEAIKSLGLYISLVQVPEVTEAK